jgi:hexokinase
MVDLHDKQGTKIFEGQDISALRRAYSLDSSFLSAIEEHVNPRSTVGQPLTDSSSDPFENLSETAELFQNRLGIHPSSSELELIRRTAELIGTRAARLSACGVAAISRKKGYDTCHVGADGSVFNKYPHFKARGALALREILDWPEKSDPSAEDPIEILAAEDGSGVGAALIAALTLERVKAGNMHGILHPENFK